MDRIPIQEAIDKVEPSTPMVDSGQELSKPSTIDEMRDMSTLSAMLGFDHGFEGLSEDAKSLIEWARSKTGQFSGADMLGFIKETIRGMGTNDKGKSLLNKLRIFAALDTRQADLQKQKELL